MSGIASMTGFARVEGGDDVSRWAWEVRSVNGRGLDVRVRAPHSVDQADRAVRQAAAAKFKRGSIQVNLTVERDEVRQTPGIDKAALAALIDDLAAVALPAGGQVAPARLDGLLQVKGVLIAPGAGTEDDVEARTAPLAQLDALFDALAAARLEEGARLQAVLEATLGEIEALTGRARGLAGRQPEAIRDKYRDAVAQLMGDAAQAAEERILQEAAALAVKADVTEELDRLDAHVEQARALLTEGAVVGRRLDFLAQEFNREANTLASKSADLELTRVSMDLKAAIDALREQAQNVE